MDAIEREMQLFSIPADLVRVDFQMDPATDDLIWGEELKEGMIVLFEDSSLRTDPSREEGPGATGFWTDKILETSRWCKIERLRETTNNSDCITFIALYADGTKRARTYNESFAWYVKTESI